MPIAEFHTTEPQLLAAVQRYRLDLQKNPRAFLATEDSYSLKVTTAPRGTLTLVFDNTQPGDLPGWVAKIQQVEGGDASDHTFKIELDPKKPDAVYQFHFEGSANQGKDRFVDDGVHFALIVDRVPKLVGRVQVQIATGDKLKVTYTLSRSVNSGICLSSPCSEKDVEGVRPADNYAAQSGPYVYTREVPLQSLKAKGTDQESVNTLRSEQGSAMSTVDFMIAAQTSPKDSPRPLQEFQQTVFRLNETILQANLAKAQELLKKDPQDKDKKAQALIATAMGFKTDAQGPSTDDGKKAAEYVVNLLKQSRGKRATALTVLTFAAKIVAGYFGIVLPG